MGIIDFESPEGIAWTVCVVSLAIIIGPNGLEVAVGRTT